MEKKRKGDTVKIAGAYQYDAIHHGNVFQRNWHKLKLQAAIQLAGDTDHVSVLDIGSGSGILTEFISENVANYTGLDANEDAIEFSTRTYANDKINFALFQIDELEKYNKGKFDRIFFLETIEHITESQAINTLQNIYRLLNPRGICVITTPNRKSMWPFIEWTLDLFKFTPTIKGYQHEKLYSKQELSSFAINCGFQIIALKSFNGIAPWLSWLGNATTNKLHDWEMRQQQIPGSLIALAIQKPVAQTL